MCRKVLTCNSPLNSFELNFAKIPVSAMEAIQNIFGLFHEMALFAVISLVVTGITVTAVLFKVFKSDFAQFDP